MLYESKSCPARTMWRCRKILTEKKTNKIRTNNVKKYLCQTNTTVDLKKNKNIFLSNQKRNKVGKNTTKQI